MNSNMALFFKRLQNVLKKSNFSTGIEEKIVIPNRIPRGPTDILQALASTVKKDPTAPHFKFHDDPFLIPSSNIGKRTFAMAQEAGRKAAHWIRQEHADLFQHQIADPPVKMFMPKLVLNDDSQVDEQLLKEVIRDVQVSSAITAYKKLEKDGVKISDDTLQDLLELLCYYNNDDTLPEEFIEERWFRQGSKAGKDRLRKTWKDGDMAESIFITLENPGSAAYCALIQGMCKYCQVDRAWQLYKETKEKNIPITTETYNSLIRVASFLKEGYDLRWLLSKDLMMAMNADGLVPNIGTLNAVLETLSSMAGYRECKSYVLKTLAEFKRLGVEPSLGSWYYVLITFCRERGEVNYILVDILNHIKGKEFDIFDMKDTFFFVTAMDICRNQLQDKDLAYQVDELLHHGNNYNLIGDSYKESIYYRHFFSILCTTEPLDVFMEHYRKFVPNIYIPEPGIMGEILQAIELNSAIEYIPKIWSDMVMFDHTDRENLLASILNIMVANEPPADSELTANFVKIAWDIWTKIEEQPEERLKKLSFSGTMLGDIMMLCLRSGAFDKAELVMDKLDKEAHKVLGLPQVEALKLFVDHCVIEKAPSKAIACIQYSMENGYSEAGSFARYLNEQLTLSETHVAKLINIVGKDVLDTQTEQG